MKRVLVVDNYDSFAYNLVQYVGSAVGAPDGGEVIVRRNDAIDTEGIRALDPDGIVISPGPGTPAEAGVSIPVFRDLEYPAVGVCLGHQALCAANGVPVGHAPSVVHGKPSTIRHDGQGIFADLPRELAAGRYHSLAIDREELPDPLIETARSVGDIATGDPDTDSDADGDGDGEQGLLMGVRHRDRPHLGVQFHPESILTETGATMIETFVRRCH